MSWFPSKNWAVFFGRDRWWQSLTLGLGLVGLTATLLVVGQAQIFKGKAAVKAVTMAITPASVETVIDRQTELSVVLASPKDRVAAVKLEIKYDPAKMSLDKITPANYLPVQLEAPVIDAVKGTGSVTLGSSPDQLKTGSGIIIGLTFTPKVEGSTKVSLTNSEVAVLGKPTNALNSTTRATIKIKGPDKNNMKPKP